jgi:hypothetical protein
MKKSALFIVLVLAFVSVGQAQVLISSFGGSASSSAGWTYTPGTSTLSGTEGIGEVLFGAPANADISGNTFLRLTANAATAPAGSFTITLEDISSNTVGATFTWGSFLGGATNTQALVGGAFNYSNIVGWTLDSGGSGQALNVSFSDLSAVTAVPEPSTFAFLIAAGIGSFVAYRRRQTASV